MEKSVKDRLFASKSEIILAFERLNKKELAGLQRFAALRVTGLPGLGWEDLLHEAVERALAGNRRWPKDISFFGFLCGTMRSLSSGYWKSFRGETISFDQMDESALREGESTVNPETEILAKSTIRRIEALFAGDAAALAILRGMAEGLSPDEVQSEAGVTRRQYASTQRRIRRTVDRAIMDGTL